MVINEFFTSKRKYLDELKDRFEKNLNCYIGGENVKEYLALGRFESQSEYNKRQTYFSFYPNLTKSLINKIDNYIFQSTIDRLGLDLELELLQFKDINGYKTSIDNFMKQILNYLLLLGEVFIYFEFENDNENIISNYDLSLTNNSHNICLILPQNVYNVKESKNGQIEKIYFEYNDTTNIYIDNNEISFIEKKDNIIKDKVITIPNQFNQVQCLHIIFDINKDSKPDPPYNDIIDINLVIYNLESLSSWDIYKNTHEITYYPMNDEIIDTLERIVGRDEKGQLRIKESQIMAIPAGAKVDNNVKDLSYHPYIERIIQRYSDYIDRLSNQRLQELFPESGIAKSYDMINQNIALSALSNFLKQCDIRIANKYYSLIGKEFPKIYNPNYPINFDLIDNNQKVININSSMLNITVESARLKLELENFKLLNKGNIDDIAYNEIIDQYNKLVDNAIKTELSGQMIRSINNLQNQEYIQ